ncbi:hypothetical protein [Paenibacillus methanolicus]|uniref:Uncharacterized protein n=1 Tax=Paenibacillus methanolicus TaxID=582686 RepID=A0A5S5BU04_9BACL|nr:hypothetical protein [Paenibacillus methanolicus]TYP70507.1 hypothetical protein BCM02_11111 [Paenibacillus methanolicus]
MKTDNSTNKAWLGAVFRFFAVVFAGAGLIMLQGLSEGLEPWIRGFMASSPLPDELRFHAASHGALIGILFSASLLAMLRAPLAKPLVLRFYFIGHLIFLGTLLLTDPALAKQSFFVFILFTAVLGILFAVYPMRRDIFRPREPKAMNRALLVMTGVALLGLLPFMIYGITGQIGDADMQFRWGEGTALGLALVYAGYLTATSRTGARTIGILQSATYVYMGAASIALPDHPGSWGIVGGASAIAYGVVYAVVVLRQLAPRASVAKPNAIQS